MSYKQTLNMVIAANGARMQMVVAMEEMAELQKEISKQIRGIGDDGNVAEEIADVQIMLEQLMMIFECKEDVDQWRAEKMKRLKERFQERKCS